MSKKNKLIIEGHDKNILVKFWNFCFGIYYKNPEVWNYLIVGGLTTIISIGSKLLLLKFFLDQKDGFELQLAEIISWIIAVLFAYFANKIIVFKSKSKNIIKEFLSFAGGRVFTQTLQMLIMYIFVTYLKLNTDFYVLLFTLLCQIMQIVVNYIISKLIVFKNR